MTKDSQGIKFMLAVRLVNLTLSCKGIWISNNKLNTLLFFLNVFDIKKKKISLNIKKVEFFNLQIGFSLIYK